MKPHWPQNPPRASPTSKGPLLLLLSFALVSMATATPTALQGDQSPSSFSCPEDFGYYADPSSCTQYFVCVFGSAIKETCSKGLLYSQALQTCDWERNVKDGCPGNSSALSPPAVEPLAENNLRNSRSYELSQPDYRQRSEDLGQYYLLNQRYGETTHRPPPQQPYNTYPAVPVPVQQTQVPQQTAPPLSIALRPLPYYNNATTSYDYPNDNYYYDDDVVEDPTTTTTTTTTTSTTRAPKVIQTASRGSASYGGGGSSTPRKTRPSSPQRETKAKILAKASQSQVRNIYLDPPFRPPPVYETPEPGSSAAKCKRNVNCLLPDCNCGGTAIPGNLEAGQVPQLVLLTFDDSVNDLNKGLYKDLFEKGRTNPNGCPISATFYVSHEWTDYTQVQNLAADGHEMASHSITHSFGEQFSTSKWLKEVHGQREILAAFGGVKLSEIRGMRAPFLAIGGNNMFRMLYEGNFTYDSSMPVYENRPPSYPYTFDYRIFHDCMIPPCPTKSWPGVWEVPMVMWQDLKGGRCSMGDACQNPPTAEGVYEMLVKNFERHYTTNRAPFGLFYHAAWFTVDHHKEGFISFLDVLSQMDDVWIVTNWQAIQWMRDPTPLSDILNFAPFSCSDKSNLPPKCGGGKVCPLNHKGGVRYMKTCQPCPEKFPWIGATGVPSNHL